jgi:hypothetical protein
MKCHNHPHILMLKEPATDERPFADLPEKRRTMYSLTKDEMQNCQWLKPLLVAQIKFQEWTPGWSLAAFELCGTAQELAKQEQQAAIIIGLILELK